MSSYVANASSLIAFRQLRRLDLLQILVGNVLAPPAVVSEVFHSTPLPPWIEQRPLIHPPSAALLAPRLGAGEREAISLALQIGNCIVLLDDLAARRTAQTLGLAVIGTVGLLLQARQRQLIEHLKPELDQLILYGFRISPTLYQAALHQVGELQT
jgi:predicted nucleic acid-binding protein